MKASLHFQEKNTSALNFTPRLDTFTETQNHEYIWNKEWEKYFEKWSNWSLGNEFQEKKFCHFWR